MEALEVLDPLTRGGLTHAVLFEVLTNLRTAGLLPITPELREPATRILDEAVDKIARKWHEDLAPVPPEKRT